MREKTKCASLLLNLAKTPTTSSEKTRRQSLLVELRSELADLKLSSADLRLIAAAFRRTMSDEKQFSSLDLLNDVQPKHRDKIKQIDRIRRLIYKRVFEPDVKKYIRDAEDPLRVKLQFDRFSILGMAIRLHPDFGRRIFGELRSEPGQENAAYADNREFLQDWFEYIGALREYQTGRRYGWAEELVMDSLAKLSSWKKRIAERTARTPQPFPFQELAQEYSLDQNEQAVIIYILKGALDGSCCSKEEHLELVSQDHFDKYANAAYFDRESRLVKNGLIELPEQLFFDSRGADIRLAPHIMARILSATPCTDEERIIEITRTSGILKLKSPGNKIDDLILPAPLKETLTTSITQCRRDVGWTLQQWGVSNNPSCSGEKPAPALLMLFYGAPGTGKTFAAEAIAHALGKGLLVTDISRLVSCWVGESEANIRRLFAQYEQIVARTQNPPALLLNECDQFLTSRMAARDAVDRMYNQMENLFLEAFERFHGLLIATTNLRDNLDNAFSRRFHVKLEFPFPDATLRRDLWRVHLPLSLPLAEDVSLSELAEHFALTGGQIAVVVKNAAVEAAQAPANNQLLTQALLSKYARLELETSFGDKTTRRIGFEAA